MRRGRVFLLNVCGSMQAAQWIWLTCHIFAGIHPETVLQDEEILLLRGDAFSNVSLKILPWLEIWIENAVDHPFNHHIGKSIVCG